MVWHKFRAVPTVEDGIRFPSLAQAAYYTRLKARKEAGEVLFFLMEVPILLPAGIKYVVDFIEFLADGSVRFIDVKGFQTPEFKLKKRLLEKFYPFELQVVKVRLSDAERKNGLSKQDR